MSAGGRPAAASPVPGGASAGSLGGTDLAALVRAAVRVLAEAGVPSPQHDARALAAHALGVERVEPLVHGPVDADVAARFAVLVERRRLREPLQHILGRTGFRHLALRVEPGVFVPRPETEVVAGAAVDEARRIAAGGSVPRVVDLCTGSGAVAVSVAQEVPGSEVTAVELSPGAVALARHNADLNGVPVTVVAGDVRDPTLLAELGSAVDVVVANPPYIPPDAVPTDPEVRDHDPDLALYGGGPDGWELPAAVMEVAVRLLRPGGLLVMEHAEVQAARARAEAAGRGLVGISTGTDLAGRDRMLLARAPGPPPTVDGRGEDRSRAPVVEDSAS